MTDDWAQAARPIKRSLRIAGHRTSVSLETLFWDRLKILAAEEGLSVAALVERIDVERAGSLSAAIRAYVLYRALNPQAMP